MSLKELFQRVKESGGDDDGQSLGQRVYIIRCSYFEIYNDSIYDLLNTQKEVAFNEPLQLQEDIRVRIIIGLTEVIKIEKRIHCKGVEGVCGRGLRRLYQAFEAWRIQQALC